MKTVSLSLVTNIGDREQMLQSALDPLHAPGLRIKRISPVYETEPLDFKEQRLFLNMAVEAETDLVPIILLCRIQSIELQLGRRRPGPPKGPPTIAIDMLLPGGAAAHSARPQTPPPAPH